jgi:hypothetical protein
MLLIARWIGFGEDAFQLGFEGSGSAPGDPHYSTDEVGLVFQVLHADVIRMEDTLGEGKVEHRPSRLRQREPGESRRAGSMR